MYNVIVNISGIKTKQKLSVSVMNINLFFLPNWLLFYLAILQLVGGI
jgi:hypothetical protein